MKIKSITHEDDKKFMRMIKDDKRFMRMIKVKTIKNKKIKSIKTIKKIKSTKKIKSIKTHKVTKSCVFILSNILIGGARTLSFIKHKI